MVLTKTIRQIMFNYCYYKENNTKESKLPTNWIDKSPRNYNTMTA